MARRPRAARSTSEGAADEVTRPRAGLAGHRWPLIVVLALAAFVLTLPLAVVVSCNVHELGHAVVGRAAGWEVDRIVPCLPSGGHVEYRRSSASGNTVESWAGGLAGAGSLLLLYGLVFRSRRLVDSPVGWAAGVALTLPLGIQLAIAGLEGTADLGVDYTDTIAARPGLFVPILLVSALVGPGLHTWWWTRRPDP